MSTMTHCKDDKWIAMKPDMESLLIPPTKWLFIPVRYDDDFVMNLASDEFKDDCSYLTCCIYAWAREWIRNNGYKEPDLPYEMEIYGLHDGYKDVEGNANLTLAIPIM